MSIFWKNLHTGFPIIAFNKKPIRKRLFQKQNKYLFLVPADFWEIRYIKNSEIILTFTAHISLNLLVQKIKNSTIGIWKGNPFHQFYGI